MFRSEFRIPAESIWKMVVYVLNALVFLLIGIKVPELCRQFTTTQLWQLCGYAALITLTAIVVRLLWVFVVGYGTRFLFPSFRAKDPYPAPQNMFLVGWMGMRGVVSLATALALPLTVADGSAFPLRNEILFLTLAVILLTLVGQGLTLPWVIRKLPLAFNPRHAYEEWYARHHATKQALLRLSELADTHDIHPRALSRVQGYYEDRLALLGDGPNTPLHPSDESGDAPADSPIVKQEHALWQELLKSERDALLQLRRGFHIGDEVMHDILRDLDHLAYSFR